MRLIETHSTVLSLYSLPPLCTAQGKGDKRKGSLYVACQLFKVYFKVRLTLPRLRTSSLLEPLHLWIRWLIGNPPPFRTRVALHLSVDALAC